MHCFSRPNQSFSLGNVVLSSGWFAEIKQGDWWAYKVAFSIAFTKPINCNIYGNFIICTNNFPIILGCCVLLLIGILPWHYEENEETFMCLSPGSLWAPREGRAPRAPESSAQVRCDEEADDERHGAAQRAGICGAAGITNCSGGQSLSVFLFPHFFRLSRCFLIRSILF